MTFEIWPRPISGESLFQVPLALLHCGLGVKVSAPSTCHRERDLREAISFESSAQNKRKTGPRGFLAPCCPGA